MSRYRVYQAMPYKSFILTIILVALLFLPFISIENLLAQDPQRGRLADGRAFRTDLQGNQLVDYIAELEVNIEALERQVKGLEDENRDKQNVIIRLQRGEKAEGELLEKEIKSVENQEDKNRHSIKVSNSCSAELIRCDERIEDLKVDYQLKLTEQVKEVSKLREQIAEYESQLVKVRNELQREQSKSTDFENRLVKLQDQYESSESEISKDKTNGVGSYADKRADSPAETASINSSHYRSFGETRIQAVDMLRSKMLTDLNSLQGLVAHRDSLAKDLNGRGVSVESSANNSNQVRSSIARFREQINSATKVHQLSSVRGVINELRGAIQSEIASLKRLTRTR